MTTLLWFWKIVIALSMLLFFFVAATVAVKGWADLRDLFRDLGREEGENGEEGGGLTRRARSR